MTTWTNEELTRIGTAEELQIASRRRDAVTVAWESGLASAIERM
jgi:hypothetical protein